MKKTTLLLVTLSLAFTFAAEESVHAQEAVVGNVAPSGATVEFDKEVHDFGNIEQYADASTEFTFTNTGTAPLIITNAKSSCGDCALVSWPKEATMPGMTNVITVVYDSERVGPINKSVTIASNASNEPTKVIRYKGTVEAAPSEEAMPVKEAPEGAPVEK